MQANEKNEGGEFMDQGWRQMQDLLDLEMPEKRKNKWGLWIPLGILGVALVVIAFIYFPVDKAVKTIPEKAVDPHKSFVQSDQNVSSAGNIASLNQIEADAEENKESLVGVDITAVDNSESLNGIGLASPDKTGSLNRNAADAEESTESLNGNAANAEENTESLNGNAADAEESTESLNRVDVATAINSELLNRSDLAARESTESSHRVATAKAGGEEAFKGDATHAADRSEITNSATAIPEGNPTKSNESTATSKGGNVGSNSNTAASPDSRNPSKENVTISQNNTESLNGATTTASDQEQLVKDADRVAVHVIALPTDARFSRTDADIVSPTITDSKPAITPIIPATKRVKPQVGLEVFGAPHFASSFELRGIEAGAMASLKLNRKWKLLGGLSYGHYNKSGLDLLGGLSSLADAEAFTVPIVADSAILTDPGSNPTIAYNKIGYDTARLLSEKFNYLHMPVVAQYRLWKFISVTGGFKISYLLNAPSSKNLSAGFSNISQGQAFDLSNSRNFLVEENILRKWDIAPMVGVAFDMGRRLALDIQYQHGLIPYIDRPTESNRQDYQRTMSVALRYRIF